MRGRSRCTLLYYLAMILFLIIVISKCARSVEPSATEHPEIEGATGELEFLVTNRNEIWRVQGNGDRRRYFTNATAVADVDYHFKKNILFWIDSGKQEIHSQPLDVNSILPRWNFKEPSRNWEPVSLAVDFIGDKVYVADILGAKIDVFELSGTYRTIVLGANLIRPLDIKFDPYERYMFVLDGIRILRFNIDGRSSCVSIVVKGIRSVHGLFIDSSTKRVYWSRNADSEVMSSNYFLQNPTSLGKAGFPHLWTKFAVYNKSIVYWASNFIGSRSGCCAESLPAHRKTIYHCNPIATVKLIPGSPAPAPAPANHNQVAAGPCDKDNGGCQHMCIVIKSAASVPKDKSPYYEGRCACNVGWMLARDLKNCTYADDVLIYTHLRVIRSHLIDRCNNTFCEPYRPITETRTRFSDFDYDYEDNYLYYIGKREITGDVIYRVHPNESDSEVFLIGEGEDYQSLAVDRAARNLYYTSLSESAISLVSTRAKQRNASVLIKNLEQPEDIFYHKTGFLYFFQTNESAALTRLSRVHGDGYGLRVFSNVRLRKPCGFTIDSGDGRIYWYERSGDNGYIGHSDLDVGDVKITRSAYTKRLCAITVHEKWIYFATTGGEGLWRIDKEGGKERQLVLADSANGISKAKVFAGKELRRDHGNLTEITRDYNGSTSTGTSYD